MTRTERRITLITGANRGLGREVALRLAEASHHVLVGARDASAATEVATELERAGHAALALVIDLRDEASLLRAAEQIDARFGRLDVLVNNAGVMLDGSWAGNTSEHISDKLLRETFDANFFGLVRLTQILLPLLRRSGDAHIVNVSSVMGSLSIHADPGGKLAGFKPFAYDASKAAVNAFTVHLAEAVADAGIRVNSAHPGWVRTALGTAAAELSVEEGARTLVELAASRAPGPTAKFVHLGSELPW